MPVTVDAEVGGEASNSYLDVTTADEYFNNRLNSIDWSGATPDNKGRALIFATKRLEEERYKGSKVESIQALKWPRAYVYDDNGDAYATDEIPGIVQDATCELALLLLGSDYLKESKLSMFNRIKVDVIELDIRHPIASGKLPAEVLRLLRGVLLRVGGQIVRS